MSFLSKDFMSSDLQMASTSSFTNQYDAFLSFRGADTRNKFTGHLYTALCNKGVNVFMDKDLRRGNEISSTLLQVIEASRISIVIFSPNYASSEFCVKELEKILECKNSKEQIVFPVFYEVDPLEVEKWTGSCHEGFAEAADMAGWDLRNRNEADVIQEIVENVLERLNLAGLKAALEESSLRSFREKKETLNRKLNELESIKADIEEQLKCAELSGKKRKNEIANWLVNVQRLKDEHGSIQSTLEEGSIDLQNRVDKLIEEVGELIHQKCRFERELVFENPETDDEVFPKKKLVGSKFQSYTDFIWSCLSADDNLSIGIFGMGGVGKTTLMISIYNKLLGKRREFGHVYWITVSKEFKVNIPKLQHLILKAIGLEFGTEEDELKRAAKLSKALSSKGKFILILDDLWNHFDMKKVGIPIENDGCKLIITTRSQEVCTRMGLQKLKKIEPLPEKEAWYLFKQTLGHDLEASIEPIAKSVSGECDGLPLGIVTMAGSMRGVDDIHDWNNALAELQRSEVRPEDMGDEVFRVLRVSYTHLNSRALQQSFLYCALFPEDYEINREELKEILVVEGIIERQMSRQMDLDKGHAILNRLIKVSLLEDFRTKGGARCIKMHDLIRDMAIQIMKECSPSMIEAGRQLTCVPEEKQWRKDIVRVSLMSNDISVIPSSFLPMCSSLSTLLMSRNKELKTIPHSFFLHFHGLKVLDLSRTRIEKLPESVGCLENLKALLLRWCLSLSVVPPLVKLVSLEMLDLSCCTELGQVPEGLEFLSNLTYLNLLWTRLENINSGMLTRLSHLQFLAFYSQIEGSSEVKPEELAELQKLESLNWHFHDFEDYNKYVQLLSSRRLINYSLFVGWGLREIQSPMYAYNPNSRVVKFLRCVAGREVFIQNDLLSLTMQYVIVGDGRGFCFKTSEMDSFKTELKSLSFKNCDNIEYLFHLSTSSSIFQSLETLNLDNLPYLRSLFGCEEGEPTIPMSLLTSATTFSCLREFCIDDCNDIKKLFPAGFLFNCKNLEKIVVSYCSELEEIMEAAEDEASCGYSPSSLKKNLQFSLPKLRCFKLIELPNLRSICSGQIVCESSLVITLINCWELENIPISLTGKSVQNIKLSVWPVYRWKSLKWGNPNQKILLQPRFVNPY